MNDQLRKERIGLAHFAAVTQLPVSEIRRSLEAGEPLRGLTLPTPIKRHPHPLFYLGDAMDFANHLRRAQ